MQCLFIQWLGAGVELGNVLKAVIAATAIPVHGHADIAVRGRGVELQEIGDIA